MLMICVYRGLGVDDVSLPMLYRCLKRYCDPVKYTVNYVSPEQISAGQLLGASLFAMGGGYDLGFIKALGTTGIGHIKRYVHDGGRYLGICAGAYLACDQVEFDKDGPLAVCGKRDLNFYTGKCIGPVFPGFVYNQYDGAWPANIDISSSNLLKLNSEDKENNLLCYFNGGGYFQSDGSIHMKNCIIAKYLDNTATGLSAIVKCSVGKGQALLSGVHFEYDPEFLDQNNLILKERVLPELLKNERQRKILVRQLLESLDIQCCVNSKL